MNPTLRGEPSEKSIVAIMNDCERRPFIITSAVKILSLESMLTSSIKELGRLNSLRAEETLNCLFMLLFHDFSLREEQSFFLYLPLLLFQSLTFSFFLKFQLFNGFLLLCLELFLFFSFLSLNESVIDFEFLIHYLSEFVNFLNVLELK